MSGRLDDDYRRAGFAGRLGFGDRPALLVVDLVRAYLDPGSPLYAGVEAVVEAAGRVLDAARAARVPVVFTRVEYAVGGADGGVFRRKVPALRLFEAGSPLAAFPAAPAPLPGELVVTKQYASAFFGTSLASTLRALAVDTVVITGLTTSGCVRASAVDACQLGFVPVVVREAVGDRDPRPHEANLFDLDAKYADVVGEREVVEHLRGIGAREAAGGAALETIPETARNVAGEAARGTAGGTARGTTGGAARGAAGEAGGASP